MGSDYAVQLAAAQQIQFTPMLLHRLTFPNTTEPTGVQARRGSAAYVAGQREAQQLRHL